jgi:hypothetical protein
MAVRGFAAHSIHQEVRYCRTQGRERRRCGDHPISSVRILRTVSRLAADQQFVTLALTLLLSGSLLAQGAESSAPAKFAVATKSAWEYNFTLDGYITPPKETSFASPIFAADRHWLHLEARYNDEDLRTGSLWAGYNFSAGRKLVLDVTPMLGGVFGNTTGITPGCEASLTYKKKIRLSISNEYVFATDKSASFYYSWPELTYSPVDWFRLGVVAQHTKAFQTSIDVQRGFLVGISHKQVEFTTYVFNAGWTEPTVVLEFGVSF